MPFNSSPSPPNGNREAGGGANDDNNNKTKKVRFQTQAERDAVSRVAVWRTERFVKHLTVEQHAREIASELSYGHHFSNFKYGEYKEALTNRCLPGLASQSDKSVEKKDREDDEDDTSEEEAEERLIIQDAIQATKHLDKSPEPGFWETLMTEPNQAYALRSSALYILPAHTTIRIFLYNVVKHRVFEGIILLVIIFNSVILAVEPQILQGAGQEAFDAMDTFITVIFSIELVLKILAFGFVLHKGAYLRDGWNCLDGFIMLTTYISLGLDGSEVGASTDLTALRTFRVIRPLRSMNAVKGLKILVRSLSGSVMKLSPVLIMLFLALFVFAILSVQLFGGAFAVWCVHNETGEIGLPCKIGSETVGYWGASCPSVNETCREVGNVVYGDYNFDNVLTGMLLLFTMTTFDGWTGILNNMFATIGVIVFPFFVLVTLIVGFIVPNLVIAVINLEYSRAQQRDREYDVRHYARVRRLTQQRTNQFLLTQQAVTMRRKFRAEREERERLGLEPLPAVASSFHAIHRRQQQELEEEMSSLNNTYNTTPSQQQQQQVQQQRSIRQHRREDSLDNNNNSNSNSNQHFQQHQDVFNHSPPSMSLRSPGPNNNAAATRQQQNSNQEREQQQSTFTASRRLHPLSTASRHSPRNGGAGAVSITSPSELSHKKLENDQRFPKLWDIDFVETQECYDDDDDDENNDSSQTSRRMNHHQQQQRQQRQQQQREEDLMKPIIIKPSHEKPAEMAPAWITFDEDAEEQHAGPSLNVLRTQVTTGFASPPPFGLQSHHSNQNQHMNNNNQDPNHHQHHHYTSSADSFQHQPSTAAILIDQQIQNNKRQRKIVDEESWEYKWKVLRKKWNTLRDWCHEFTEGYERSVAGRLALVSGGESDFSEVSSNDTELEQFVQSSKGEETSSSVQNLAAAEAGVEQSSSRFSQFIILCIMLNTAVLASQHYDQPDWLSQFQDIMNLIFTVIFAVEMVLRLMSLGFEKYTQSSFNNLDGMIVISSLIELGLSGGSVLSVFRALRLLRVLKLLKQFPTIRALVRVAFAAMADTLYLLLIICLYLFIFALLGNSLFKDAVEPDEENRTSFNSFADSFYTAFQLLSQDLWAPLMYKTMEATNPAAALFFIIQIFFGSFVLLAMFLSILVETFNRMDQRRILELQEADEDGGVDSNMFKQNMLDSHVVRKIYSQGTIEETEEDDVGVSNVAFLRFLPESLRRDLVRAQEYEEELEAKMLSDYKRRQSRLGSLRLHQQSIGMNDTESSDPMTRGPGNNVDDVSSPYHVRADPSISGFGSSSPSQNNNNKDENPDPFYAASLNHNSNNNNSGKITNADHTASFTASAAAAASTSAAVNINPLSADALQLRENSDNNNNNKQEFVNLKRAESDIPPSPTWLDQIKSLWEDPDDENNRKNREGEDLMMTGGINNNNRLNSNVTVYNVRGLPTIPTGQRIYDFIEYDVPNRPKTLSMFNRAGKRRPDKDIYGELGAKSDVPDSMLPREFRDARLKRKQSQNIFFAPPPRRIKDIVPAIILFHEGPAPEDKCPKERNVTCARCGEIYAQPLPAAPLIAPPDPEMFHSLQCHRIRLRKAKERILNAMKNIVSFYIANDEEQNPEKVEAILCCAWSVKCMKNVTTEDILEKDSPWHTLESEIQEELDVLALRTGEEELGKSLVAYAFACIPVEHTTNGGESLWIFGASNEFRLLCSKIVWNPIFEFAILFSIICSSVLLAMQNPLDDPNSVRTEIVYWLSLVFTIIFTIEAFLKIVAFGFIFHQGAYLRDLWNWLDFIVVIVSLISDTRVAINFRVLRILKTFRALRPLRILNRNSNLKTTAYAMAENLKAIANVALLMLIALFIFAILAVQLFGGKFQSCTDSSITSKEFCNGTWIDPNSEVYVRGPPFNDSETYPLEVPRIWRSEPRNFDNVGLSLLTLFQISTSEAWSEILWRSFDACSETEVIQNCSKEQGLFFVGFFAIAGFFLTQLFVSFIIHNYDMVQESINGANQMTEEQKVWVQTQQLLVNLRPFVAMVPEDDAYARWIYTHIVSKWYFDPALAVFIITDILSIALFHYNMSDTFKTVLQAFNIFFQIIFTIEAFLKISAFRKRYFKNGSNQFDFCLVLIGFVGLAASDVQGLVVLRVFRFLRIMRLLRSAQGVQILLETIVYSLPSIANMGAFIVLITFCFGVLGVELLATLYIPPDADVLDNRYNNFKQLDYALMLLYRFLTLEDWIGALKDTMIEYPKCATDRSCGDSGYALYFCAFIIINSYVILNLVMAIILVNFELTMKLTGANVRLGQFHKFVDIWSEYDNATLQLSTNMLPLLLYRLGPPLGLSRKDSRNQIMRCLKRYFIPEHGGNIHFIEVLLALAQGSKETDLSARDQREFSERLRSTFPELLELPVYRHNQRTLTADLYFAQAFMAAAYRRNSVVEKQLPRLRAERRETMRSFCERQRIPVPEPRVFMRIPLRLGARNPDMLSTSDGNATDIASSSFLGQQLLLHAYRKPKTRQQELDDLEREGLGGSGGTTTTAMFNLIMESLNHQQNTTTPNTSSSPQQILRSPTGAMSPASQPQQQNLQQGGKSPSTLPRKFNLDEDAAAISPIPNQRQTSSPQQQQSEQEAESSSATRTPRGSSRKSVGRKRGLSSSTKKKKNTDKEQEPEERKEEQQQQQDHFVVRVQSPDGTLRRDGVQEQQQHQNQQSEMTFELDQPKPSSPPSSKMRSSSAKKTPKSTSSPSSSRKRTPQQQQQQQSALLPPVRSTTSTQQQVTSSTIAESSFLSPTSLRELNQQQQQQQHDQESQQQRPRSYSDTSSINPINLHQHSPNSAGGAGGSGAASSSTSFQQQPKKSALKPQSSATTTTTSSASHSRSESQQQQQSHQNYSSRNHSRSASDDGAGGRGNTPVTPERRVNFVTNSSSPQQQQQQQINNQNSHHQTQHRPQTAPSFSSSRNNRNTRNVSSTDNTATSAVNNNNNQEQQPSSEEQLQSGEDDGKSGSRPFPSAFVRIVNTASSNKSSHEEQSGQKEEQQQKRVEEIKVNDTVVQGTNEDDDDEEEFIVEEFVVEEEEDEEDPDLLSRTTESETCEKIENHEQVGRWAIEEEQESAFDKIDTEKYKSYATAFLEADRQLEIRSETRIRNDIKLQERIAFDNQMMKEFRNSLNALRIERDLKELLRQPEPKFIRLYNDFTAEHDALIRQCWYEKHLLELQLQRHKLEKDFEVLAESTFVDEEKLERFAILDRLHREGNFLRRKENILKEGIEDLESKLFADEEDSWNALMLKQRAEETQTRRFVLTRNLVDVEREARNSILNDEATSSRRPIIKEFEEERQQLLNLEYQRAFTSLDQQFDNSLDQIKEEEDSDRLMIMSSFRKQMKIVIATIHFRERSTLEDEEQKFRQRDTLKDEARIYSNMRIQFVSDRKFIQDKEDEEKRLKAIEEQQIAFAKQRLEVEQQALGHSREVIGYEELKERKVLDNSRLSGATSIRNKEFKLQRDQFCETETETRNSVLIAAEQQRADQLFGISSSLHKMARNHFAERESCLEDEEKIRSSIVQEEGESHISLSSLSNSLYEQTIAEYFAAIRKKTETKLNALQKREIAERNIVISREEEASQKKWNCPVCLETPPYRLSHLASDINEHPNGMGFEKLRQHLHLHKVEIQKIRMHRQALRTETIVSRNIIIVSAFSTWCFEMHASLSELYLARGRETYRQLSVSDAVTKSLDQIHRKAAAAFADDLQYFTNMEEVERLCGIEEPAMREAIDICALNQPLIYKTVDVDERDPLVVSMADCLSAGGRSSSLTLEQSFASRRREQRPLLEEPRLLDPEETIPRKRVQLSIIARAESSDDEDCFEPLSGFDDSDSAGSPNSMSHLNDSASATGSPGSKLNFIDYTSPNAAKAAILLRALSNSPAPPTRTASPRNTSNFSANSNALMNNLLDHSEDTDDDEDYDDDDDEQAQDDQQQNQNNQEENNQQQQEQIPRRLQLLLKKLQHIEESHRKELSETESIRRNRLFDSFQKGLTNSYHYYTDLNFTPETLSKIQNIVRLEAVRRQGLGDAELNERLSLYRSPKGRRIGLGAVGAIPHLLTKSPSRLVSRATSAERTRRMKMIGYSSPAVNDDASNNNQEAEENLTIGRKRRNSHTTNPYYSIDGGQDDDDDDENATNNKYYQNKNTQEEEEDDDDDTGSPHRRFRDVLRDQELREKQEQELMAQEKEERERELASLMKENDDDDEQHQQQQEQTSRSRKRLRQYQGLPIDKRFKQISIFERQIEALYEAVEMRREYLANVVLKKVDKKIFSQGRLPPTV